MMRLLALLLLACSFVVAGCGGDDDDESARAATDTVQAGGAATDGAESGSGTNTTAASTAAGGDDEQTVRDAIDELYDALAAGDGERACGFMTEEAQADTVEDAQELGADRDTTCAEAVAGLGKAFGDALKRRRIESVRVQGDTASARVAFTTEGLGPAELELVRAGDGWKVSDPDADD